MNAATRGRAGWILALLSLGGASVWLTKPVLFYDFQGPLICRELGLPVNGEVRTRGMAYLTAHGWRRGTRLSVYGVDDPDSIESILHTVGEHQVADVWVEFHDGSALGKSSLIRRVRVRSHDSR